MTLRDPGPDSLQVILKVEGTGHAILLQTTRQIARKGDCWELLMWTLWSLVACALRSLGVLDAGSMATSRPDASCG